MTYGQWAAKYPEAAAAQAELLGAVPWAPYVQHDVKSEAWAQQQDRMTIARAGGMTWRNNVGATPTKCPDCGAKHAPVRYGLANDSTKLNKVVKSHDLIGIMPRHITAADVGQVIGQFISIESKRPGWTFDPLSEHEQAQAAWGSIIERLGGIATFSTGDVKL